MKYIKEFFQTYKNSITSVQSYSSIPKKPFFFSIRFMYLLSFFILFLSTVLISINIATQLPKLSSYFVTLNNELRVAFPSSLIITIKDGIISTNSERPVQFDVPSITKDLSYAHLITLDTNASIEEYPEKNSLVLITKDSFVFPKELEDSKSYQTESAQQLVNRTVTYASYQQFLEKFAGFTKKFVELAPYLLILSVLVIPVIGSFFVVTMRLVYLLFTTLLLWGISSLFKNTYSYKDLFQMSMHGLAMPITFMLLLNSLGMYSSLIFTSGFLLWMVIVLAHNKKTESE